MSSGDSAGEFLPGFESTHMFREATNASAAVRAQFALDRDAMQSLGAEIRRLAPRTVITCARGSSDHAATYGKYLIETRARVPTASAALSISSVYGVRQDLRQCLYIAISQSGRSPDLLASIALAKQSGATVLAICNSPDAPLNAGADHVIALRAGPEQSVAATKSYLATLAALARFVAAWTSDTSLDEDLERLPDLMDEAWRMDWTGAVLMLAVASTCMSSVAASASRRRRRSRSSARRPAACMPKPTAVRNCAMVRLRSWARISRRCCSPRMTRRGPASWRWPPSWRGAACAS
jgi:fructoselysine-6-P-deglycase FrlB-like protein